MPKKKDLKKSDLAHTMRMAYEDLAEALVRDIYKHYPRDKKTRVKIEESVKRVLDREFGPVKGGVFPS